MDAVKRASFASKQCPNGPAPLASFEDLPSDELESPEDTEVFQQSSSQDIAYGFEDSPVLFCGRFENLPESTPDTLSVSTQSTPQIESDYDSHCTLTPGDSKICSATELMTGSLSSLSREEDTLQSNKKKGSASSLGTQEMEEHDLDQRKSSWTDIFRSHNQNSKVISPDPLEGEELKTKSLGRKKHHKSKKDQTESKNAKERGKFLSIFKVGTKKTHSRSSEFNSTSPDGSNLEQIRSPEERVPENSMVKEQPPKFSSLEEKENKQPLDTQFHPVQVQNDLDKSSLKSDIATVAELCGTTKNGIQNLNIAEKEPLNILSLCSNDNQPIKKTINRDTSLEDDRESSESEPTSEAKDKSLLQSEESKDDFENENLLTQDSSEIEDDSSIELHPVPFKVPHSSAGGMLTRHQRLEVTTKPIERPRSTTPINVAPFEAFIHAATPPSFDPKMEKIKLSLPGEQFVGRLKSPKRNVAKSWADFCEEGLHSPRMQKKTDDEFSENFEDTFESCMQQEENQSCWDRFQLAGDSPWVAFGAARLDETLDERPDLFKDLPTEDFWSEQSQQTSITSLDSGATLSKCKCCNSGLIKGVDGKKDGSTLPDVFSDRCQCQCHERYYYNLWNPSSDQSTESNSICDIRKAEIIADVPS